MGLLSWSFTLTPLILPTDAWLSEESLAGCAFELITVDTRGLPYVPRGVQAENYWAMTAVLNYAYARRWGYGYHYVEANWSAMGTLSPTWGKVFFVAERLRTLANSVHRGKCIWLVFLDSDAFIREPDVPLPVFLGNLGYRYRLRRKIGVIFAQEEELSKGGLVANYMRGYNPKVPWLNTGVFFVQANVQGRRFAEAWEAAASLCSPDLHENWPHEQGVVTELLLPGTFPAGRAYSAKQPKPEGINYTFAAVKLTEFNSPWGRFAAHIWTYHSYSRLTAYWDAFVRMGLQGPNELSDFYPKVYVKAYTWSPRPLRKARRQL